MIQGSWARLQRAGERPPALVRVSRETASSVGAAGIERGSACGVCSGIARTDLKVESGWRKI